MVKGFLFTLDALIASILIISVVALVPYFYLNTQDEKQTIYMASDITKIISDFPVQEINDTNVIALLNGSSGNYSVLEQAFRYQVKGYDYKAEELLQYVLEGVVPKPYEFAIYMEGYDEPIFSTSNSSGNTLYSSKQLVSGIERDRVIEGVSSRAFISSIDSRGSSSYAFFGGYEGDGNLTKKVVIPTGLENVSNFYMELSAGGSFDLFINNNYSGHYAPSNFVDEWNINSSYYEFFNEGDNYIKLGFDTSSQYVGGGYLRVDYSTSELSNFTDEGVKKEYLPGIDGTLNLFSSFHIPGELNDLTLNLIGNTSDVFYVTIGDTIVYEEELTNNIILDNNNLSNSLNYSNMHNKTIPIRIGFEETNFSEELGEGYLDVVLITDLSDSMEWNLESETEGIERSCTNALINDSSTKRLSLAKCLDKLFINNVLNESQNRVALAAFYGDDSSPYKGRVRMHSLTNDVSDLETEINDYSAQGGTCICCAINTAYKILDEESDPTRAKMIVVMSDGIPTHTCSASNNCEGTRTGLKSKEGLWLGSSGCYGGTDDCDTNDCDCAIHNANWSSCRAYDDLGSIVFSIGFGPVGECSAANKTMQSIAECGNGEYYTSQNATILYQIYDDLSARAFNISYEKQKSVVTGLLESTLSPDSYIKMEYDPYIQKESYGLIPVYVESQKFGNNISEYTLNIPDNIEVYEAKVTSYSGDSWTDLGIITNNKTHTFFNLSEYNDEYIELGDPFLLEFPAGRLTTGNNIIKIRTGINSINTSGGSEHNRIIYRIGIDTEINFSGVFETAEGCNWNISYEDGSNKIVSVPSTYSGSKTCIFDENTDCSQDYTIDAIDNSVCSLLKVMDYDNDGKVFLNFGPGDLNVNSHSLGKIPYMWGPSVVETRVWK